MNHHRHATSNLKEIMERIKHLSFLYTFELFPAASFPRHKKKDLQFNIKQANKHFDSAKNVFFHGFSLIFLLRFSNVDL